MYETRNETEPFVARRTVRKALRPLVTEGLVETRPGWGTFVAHAKEA
jgi:DNA-binding GntR family transcriptional regulator